MNFRAVRSKLVGFLESDPGCRRTISSPAPKPGRSFGAPWLAVLLLIGAGLTSLRAQDISPRLEAGRVQVTASAERSTLNRVTGVLTSAVDIEATNTSGQRIDGPVHAIIAFKTPEGVEVRKDVTVPGALGGFDQDPWQQPYFDLTPQLGANGWQPGAVLRLPLSFSRARTLSVLYEVSFAGRINHEPVVNPGGPYTGRVGSEITFTGTATDPDGDPLTFAWDFGSGSGAATPQASRAFATAGAPRVTLTVSDGRGGVVVRDVTVLVAPPGNFALAHSRIVDGTGHPLGDVQVTENGPLGSREFAAGDEGFVSLGLTAGDYRWTFSAPGHRPVHRQAALIDGGIRLLPSPWLAREGAPAGVSVLESTTLTSGNSAVRLIFPAGAFTQPGVARLTALGPQTLPFPLPFGWSPLAAFHLELPETPTLPAASRLKLAAPVATDEALTLVRFDETARAWRVMETGQADPARRDEFNFSLGESGSVAALVRDSGPGAPPLANTGDPLPAGTAQNLESLVTAVGSVTPQEKPASLDPDAVTAVGEAVFTPATGGLPSGSWFRLGVQETYDLTDGTGLRTPDYDATVYAYRRPGPGGSTARAAFPLRPRLLFGPADLKEAHLHVEVLPPLGNGPAALSEAGGSLGSGGFQVVIPPNALGGVAVGSLRSLGVAGFTGLAGPGFVVTGAFELNLAGLAPGTVLDFSMTTPVAPGADFILAKLVSFSGGSGLAPVQRLRSNAAGVLTNAEPDSPPRLPGLTGPGQYLLVQLPAAEGLVTGVVRTSGGVPAGGIGTRVTGQPWLSVTGADGRYSLTSPAGQGTVLASNSANGDGAAAAFTMPAALTGQTVDLTLGALAPRVLAVTPEEGALKVSVVAPLTVEFSEKIAPGSLGATPLTLRAAGAAADVPAGFTLELSNRILTLLPVNPLEPATVYTLTVSPSIRDLQNLVTEGPLEFTFTTAAPAARGEGAQLVIYEPGAAGQTSADQAIIDNIPGYTPGTDQTKVVAIGTAGSADPEVPVILVNESTGTTVTVLSKPDGSFANCIDAVEEDFISATFVNTNGTRVSIAASRQKFDDGRVGLFEGGGILEAEGDGGAVQVIVAPDAIPERTKFKVSVLDSAVLLGKLQGALPDEGKLLGGLRIEAEGDPLTERLNVVFPVQLEDLGLPPGLAPQDATFAVGRVIEVNGVKAYDILEDAHYEDGKVITNSPPMFGLFPEATPGGGPRLTPIEALFFMIPSSGAIFTGRVVKVPAGSNAAITTSEDVATLTGVAGAIVSAGAATSNPGLRPGAFVSRTNAKGFYSVILPVEGNGPAGIRATSDRFPGLIGLGQATRQVATKDIRIVNLAFRLPENSENDTVPPIVTVSTPASVLPPGVPVALRFNALDDHSTPAFLSIDWVRGGAADPNRQGSYGLDGTALSENEVTLTPGQLVSAGQSAQQFLNVKVGREARLVFKVIVADGAGNRSERLLSVVFTPELDPPPVGPLRADPNDTQAPQVVAITPNSGETIGGLSTIEVFFNEAISTDVVNGLGVSVFGSVSGAIAVGVRIANDQLSASLSVAGLRAGEEVTVSLVPPIRDLRGNLLEPFVSRFRVAAGATATVTNSAATVATFVRGAFGIVIERGDAAGGKLRTYRLSGATPLAAGEAPLPAFPRVAALVPRFDFKMRPSGPTLSHTVLVVAGGTLGSDNLGQWIRVIDLDDMGNPLVLASKLALQDFASAISILKVSEGAIYAAANTPEGPLLYRVGLQGLILGGNYTLEDFAANPSARFGTDLNRDGDYVDAGEQLPVPVKIGLPGLETTIDLEPGRTLNDFDVLEPGGALLGFLYASKSAVPGRFDLTRIDGEILRSAEFAAGENPFRLLLDANLEVMTATGRRSLSPSGIVTVSNQVRLFDLGGPLNPGQVLVPPVVQTIALPTGSGSILAVARDDRRGVVLATNTLTFLLSRDRLGFELPPANGPHPGLQTGLDLASAGRNLGVSPGFFGGVVGGNATFMVRPPRISVVRLPSRPVLNTATLTEQVAAAISGEAVPQEFILPCSLKAAGPDFPAAIDTPPPPDQHYYVFIEAPGDLGSEMTLAIESLRRDGKRQAPKGQLFGPVILTDLPGSADVAGAQPDCAAQKAYRLSSNPAAPEYNLYLSQPLLVIREALSEEILTLIRSVPGRQPLQIGEQLRVSMEKLENLQLLPDADSPQPTDGEQPPAGISHTVASFCAEFVDSGNPSPPASSSRFGGVSLQSGEFQMLATDFAIEGRATSLSLMRSYESQSHFAGPFGRGWDFNWNRHLCELPSGRVPAGTRLPVVVYGDPALDLVARPGDVILLDGSNDSLLFRRIGPIHGNVEKQPHFSSDPAITEFGWQGRIVAFYESPRGHYEVLYKFADGSYVMVDPSAARVYFDAEGRLQKVVAPYSASTTKLTYRADGKLDKVEGDRGITLEFGYYGRTTSSDFRPLDLPYPHTSNIGLIGRVKAGADNRTYRYNARNDLERVISLGPFDLVYGYDPQAPHQMTSVGRGDGAGEPSQTLSYENGLVKKVTVGGEMREIIGAVGSAKDRLAVGDTTISLKTGDKIAEFKVDKLGASRGFAGSKSTPSSDGTPGRIEAANGQGVNIVRDEANPVYRFRGNVTRIEGQTGTATSQYDGSAWNRLEQSTMPSGVVTDYDFAVAETGENPGRQLTITVGGVNQRVLHFDPWGSFEREEHREAGVGFTKQAILDFAEGLPKGFKLGDQSAIEFGRVGSMVGSVKIGGVGMLAPSFSNDGLLKGLGAGPKVPALALGYDGVGRLETATFGEGEMKHTTTYASATSNLIRTAKVEETGVPPATLNFGHDDFGRLESVQQNGRTTNIAYTGATVTAMTGPGVQRALIPGGAGGNTTLMEQGVAQQIAIAGDGSVQSITTQGARRTFTYGPGGRVESQTVTDVASGDPLLSENYTYDPVGRLQKTVSADCEWERDYFPDHGLRSIKVNGTEVRRAGRNNAGLITHVETLAGALRADYSEFDPISNRPGKKVLTLQGGQSLSEMCTFDEMGRIETRSVGGLAPWRFGYNGFGQLGQITDPDGVTVHYSKSPSGLPLGQTFADGSSVTYSYADDRVLTGIGDVQILPNGDRQPGTITYPDGISEEHTGYNVFMRPSSVTIGGVAQLHTWTEGRLTRVEVPSTGDVLEFGYDGLGRVRTNTANGYTIGYGYSPCFGQISETTPAGIWSLTLNASGQPTGERYPSGLVLDFVPGENGQPTKLEAAGISAVSWAGLAEPAKIEFADGLKVTRNYDSALRLAGVTFDRDGGVVGGFEWGLSPGGRLLHEKRLHDADRFDVYARNTASEGRRITGVTFDAESAAGEGSATLQIGGIDFTAEGEINFSAATTSGGGNRGILPTQGDQLVIGPRGLPTSGPVWANLQPVPGRFPATFDYDGFGRLRRIERRDPTTQAVRVTVTYRRDGRGRIIEREVTGPPAECRPGTFRYVWRGGRLLEEYQVVAGANQIQRRYFYLGNSLIAVQAALTTNGPLEIFVPMIGYNGSICGYLRPTGEIMEVIRYGLYGLPAVRANVGEVARSGIGPTLLFQGAFYEEEAGLYDFTGRTLHPVLGRFMERDPELYKDSRALYLAFEGDPASNIDPGGSRTRKAKGTRALTAWESGMTDAFESWSAWGSGGEEEADGSDSFLETSFGLSAVLEEGEDGSALDQFTAWTAGQVPGATAEKVRVNLKKLGEVKSVLSDYHEKAGEFIGAWKKLSDANANVSRFDYIVGKRLDHVIKGGIGITTDSRFGELSDTRRRELASAASGARMDFAEKSVGLASFALSGVKAVYDKSFPEREGRDPTRFQVVAGSGLEVTGKLLEVAEAAFELRKQQQAINAALAGGEAAQIEATIGGLKISGSASSVAMRGLVAVQAAQAGFDAGFAGGKALFTLALGAVDPGAAALYKKDIQTFEKNGGFNLSLLGGALATIGAPNSAVQKLQDISDTDYAEKAKAALGLDGTGAGPKDSLFYYYKGLRAP